MSQRPPWGSRIVRWLTGTRRTGESGGSTTSSTDIGAAVTAEFADWSDAELYAVWCSTGTELVRALQAHRVGTAAEARRYLLSEIERRHPASASAWLSSDAVLSGEPPHFLLNHTD